MTNDSDDARATQTTTTDAASGAGGFAQIPASMLEQANQHAVDLAQCALFVDAKALAKAMTDASAFLRQVALFPVTAPHPAGAERVDLGELERLSAAASQGDIIAEPYKDEHGGCYLMAGEIQIAAGLTEEDGAYFVALVNAHRSGHLVPASLGSGEGTAGASSGPGSREPSPSVSASGFDPSRETLGNRVLIQVIESGYYYCALNEGVTDRMSDAFVYSHEEAESIVRDGKSRLRMVSPPAPCDGSGEAGETHSGSAHEHAAPSGATPHPQSPSLSEVEEAKAVLAEPYLIRKGGYYYRPNRCGYTATPHDAGHYTREEAEAEASIEPWHMSAVKLSDALATLTASQEQDGGVRS